LQEFILKGSPLGQKSSPPDDLKAIREDVSQNINYHLGLLAEAVKTSFSSLTRFQSWVGGKMKQIGLEVEEFIVDPEDLVHQPACQKTLRENPSALQSGPNLVGRLTGPDSGGGLLLFAHADKFPETFDWGRKHPDMVEREERLYAPGIADDVSGITAMISAVETFRRLGFEHKRDLMAASVLGKQMSLYGTYGLMKRYAPMDHAIYVHPAESGDGLSEIHMASNGMIEFRIEIEGKPPDTSDPFQIIYPNSAVSAAEKGVYIFEGLHRWAAEASDRYRHSGLEELSGQALALLVARFTAGTENLVYETPLRCVLEGTVSFPPNASLDTVQGDFKEAFERLVKQDSWLNHSRVSLEWGDHIGESVQSDEQSPLLLMASRVLTDVTGRKPHYFYGHALSDIRYPLLYWNAQAFGIGPVCGDIGKESEWIDRKEYLDTIVAVTQMLSKVVSVGNFSP
jgi:acetylornithine deacetylase/succinyl-diaminopimelate desuccinylase-like protein